MNTFGPLNYFHDIWLKLAKLSTNLFNYFYMRMYLILILGLIMLNWLFAYIINVNVSQNLVILHYNVDFGVNLIGDVSKIYIIPLLGLVIFLINMILMATILKQRHCITSASKFLSHILLAGTLFSNFILLISLASIYLINFYR